MNRVIFFGTLFFTTFLHADANFDLLRYSYIGDIVKISQALSSNANLESRDENERTPLLLAAFEDNSDALRFLLDKGADINATSFSGRNALSYAIQNSNLELVRLLLSKESALNLDGSERDSLYTAIVHKNSEVLRLILPYQKNLNLLYLKNSDQKDARNLVKTTLLIQAVISGSLENVKLLLQMGADINMANDRGETPILTALREEKFEIATFLADHGAELNVRDVMGNTVLSYALNHQQTSLALKALYPNGALHVSDLSTWFSRDCVRVKDWVLRDEEDIREHKNDALEWNYLHIAALNNQVEVIKALLSKGMKIEEQNRGEIEKLPALAWAIKRGNYEAFKALLDAKADPYERYKGPTQGDRGLMYVAGGGSFYTPLSYAMSGDKTNIKIIETLMKLPHFERYVKNETHAFYQLMLILSSDEGGERQTYAKEIIKRFKADGFLVNDADLTLEKQLVIQQKNQTPQKKSPYGVIDEALKSGDIKTIKKMKDFKIDIVKAYKDAPIWAAIYNHSEMILPLIDLGYDKNVQYHGSGENILNSLVTSTDKPENVEIFWELVKRGVNLNNTDQNTETPLMHLSQWRKKSAQFQDQLISNGANLGTDPKALQRLYIFEDKTAFLSLVKDSRLSENLQKLYRDSNLTKLALISIKSKNTPQSITIHLFNEAYKLGLFIDYKTVLEKAKKENLKEIIQAVQYYGNIEPAPLSLDESYTKYLDAGMIDKALDFYLSHTKELNAIAGFHERSRAPLSVAIEHQKKSTYEAIVKAGALIDDANHVNGDMLIEQNDLESIKLFIKLGMNLNHIGRYENSYFFRALYYSNENTTLAKELVKIGYNPINPNLSRKRNIEDLALAYKVASKKGDKELADYANQILDKIVKGL
jgi:ankyrin repeat protein